MSSETATARTAPQRRITGREVSGGRETDQLECGHTVNVPYTGWVGSRRCVACALKEADR